MSSTVLAPVSPSGPTDLSKRALAPDLARGFMLLAIALAHTPLFVSDLDFGWQPLNDVCTFIHTLLVNNQARPMFVFLFGYGLAQLLSRQEQRGEAWKPIRKLLRRRGIWMFVIGLAHGILIAPVDIIAYYGVSAFAFAAMVRAKDRTLLWTAGLTFIPYVVMMTWGVFEGLQDQTSAYGSMNIATTMSDNPMENMAAAAVGMTVGALFTVPMIIPGMLLGIWAGRRRYLDEPERHRALLARASTVLFGLGVVGGIPAAMMLTGMWNDAPEVLMWVAAAAQPTTGMLGGIGMAGLVGLAAIKIAQNRGRVVTAIEALGQRSMTFYIFQSVVFLALFYPYTLDLADSMGLAGATGVAVAIWLASLVLAEALRRAGRRGPFETLLRRLSYRRRKPVPEMTTTA
ncbi:MAG: DUF418 domain-containing protein [Stackebrandtia sp.]